VAIDNTVSDARHCTEPSEPSFAFLSSNHGTHGRWWASIIVGNPWAALDYEEPIPFNERVWQAEKKKY
jgi:hypothetical protein